MFIERDSKEAQLDESIPITDDSHLLVKTATIYWKYNNVFSRSNKQISGFKGMSTHRSGLDFSRC